MSNKKQKMGTYAVNIYGWLMCKLTVPQRTIESKMNMQYIIGVVLLQKIYRSLRSVWLILLVFCVLLLCVFTFWVPCCDFRIQTMVGANQMFEINFVNHDILHQIKTGYIQTDDGGVNTQ
jgi:hypothetical protein